MTAITAVHAQHQWSETYPAPSEVPPAKPEWLALIANATISNAPITPTSADGGPDVSGMTTNDYCNWTFDKCIAPTDLYTCPTAGVMAVTFDDGPSEFSPRLYDYLDSVNHDLTFFMVGSQVHEFPEIARRAFDAGHELAMHTWSHHPLTTLTNDQIVAELKWNEQVIREVTGYSPKFFRPPQGNIDNRVRDIAAALGFIPVIWTHDTNDWQMMTNPSFDSSYITGNISAWGATNATTGGISLSHDIHEQTVVEAIEYMPLFDNYYTLQTVGRCNNIAPYKESDSYSPATEHQPSASTLAAPAAPTHHPLFARQLDDGHSSIALSSAHRPAAATATTSLGLSLSLVALASFFFA
ncbi:hypothetical protein BX666DRAFT_1848795 [Dichotomocladium elegans]|nr:hypothetical protein BX666DRAFT_1848795 [Dichotomocladium elegans]